MRKYSIGSARRLSLLVMTAVAFFSVSAAAVYADEAKEPNGLLIIYGEDRFIMSENFDGEERQWIAPDTELWTFPEDADIDAVLQRLEEEPGILHAEPDYERRLFNLTNDPYIREQWWIPHIHSASMWQFASMQKKPAVVAVLDSGISAVHEDLQGRIHPAGYNFYDNDSNIADVHGHGTNVSGIIAAAFNNGIGITGVAGSYNVQVLPLRVTDARGYSKVSNIVKAIDYAIEKRADVINLSMGSPQSSVAENAAVQRAVKAGITIVASAGNDALKGNRLNYPASYDNVLSVSAVDSENQRAGFASYNERVSITAPGVKIYTTARKGYVAVSGTSFSAPIVAGAAAVAKSLNPDIVPSEMKTLLESTATDLGPRGKDPYFGAGLLNLKKLQSVVFEEEEKTAFAGDFPNQIVGNDKVFTVTFSHHLQEGEDYSAHISIVTDGGEALFKAEADSAAMNKLYIRPLTEWAEGVHYMTISKELKNADGAALKKEVKLRFDVVGERAAF